MKKIIIEKNEDGQRLDRFLKKYLNGANNSFIYKMLRKKNIKLNNNKADASQMIYEGDEITLFLADETINKFQKQAPYNKASNKLDIVFEDDNIIIINKPEGLLSHGTKAEFEENTVDSLVDYLISKGEYLPRLAQTFRPSICNRLDRNTSGLIIGAKNYQSLKAINHFMRENYIKRYYLAIVSGIISKPIVETNWLIKNESTNKVSLSKDERLGAKKIITEIVPIKNTEKMTLIEIRLLTGRTHQIRSQLKNIYHPIIGDRKYGNPAINRMMLENYGLKNQWLICHKVEFEKFDEDLSYLSNKTFEITPDKNKMRILNELFEGK